MEYETEIKTWREKTTNFKTKRNYPGVPNRYPPPLLINFLIFFRPGHSYSNLQPINYWEKFPKQKNFLKQYTYANLFPISQKEWPLLHCVLFCNLV